MESRSYNIPLLSDKNFPTWKVQMKMSLMKDSLYGIVDGSEVAPTEASALSKFNIRRDRALAIIVLAIDPKFLYIVGDPSDPKVVWDKLGNTFQRKTWANKLRLRKRLYNMKFSPNDNLQEHLKTYSETFDELAICGDVISEEDRVISLLASLPDEYGTLVTALEALEKVSSWETVTERLLHEERKINSKMEENTSENKALFSKKYAKNKAYPKNKPLCFECNSPTHLKKDCYVYKEKLKKLRKHKANKASEKQEESDENITFYASAFYTKDVNAWIVDSGASQHMTNDSSCLQNFKVLETPIRIEIGDGRTLFATGLGDTDLTVSISGVDKNCCMKDILFVPDLSSNLISVSQVTKKGINVNFGDKNCQFTKGEKVVAVADKVGKLYVLNCSRKEVINLSHTSSKEVLWHRRFCHAGRDAMKNLVKFGMVKGLDYSPQNDMAICENCIEGKHSKTPFPKRKNSKTSAPLEIIHSDVCGKLPVSLGGGQYFVTFIDDSTRYCWTYILKNKSEVFEKFKEWKILVENQYNKRIKVFRSDNGGEYCSTAFKTFLKSNGIVHQTTIPRTPEQNGLSERKNRSLVEMVRSMLSDSKLAQNFWAEALVTAVYVQNRCSTHVLEKTPYEMLNNRKPNVKHFKTFGCLAFSHIPNEERGKLDFKSKKCIFLGYGSVTKGYRLYDTEKQKTFFSRNVKFDEFQTSSSPEVSKFEGSVVPETLQNFF